MAKLKPSAAKKAKGALYQTKGSAAKNALRKLERHLKKHPNDAQAKTALKNGVNPVRKAPQVRLGWVSESVKAFMGTTPPSRTLAREAAQALAFANKIARMQRTKAEQKRRPLPKKTASSAE